MEPIATYAGNMVTRHALQRVLRQVSFQSPFDAMVVCLFSRMVTAPIDTHQRLSSLISRMQDVPSHLLEPITGFQVLLRYT